MKQRAWLLDELNLWRRDAIVTEQQAVFVLMPAAATLVGWPPCS